MGAAASRGQKLMPTDNFNMRVGVVMPFLKITDKRMHKLMTEMSFDDLANIIEIEAVDLVV